MRAKILLPSIEHLSVSNYSLYPGIDQGGLDLSFVSGVTVIAGINGLGKTTILNLLLRMLLGPMERRKGERELGRVSERVLVAVRNFNFFEKRVPETLGADSLAALTFKLGTHEIKVTRYLRNLELKSVLIDGRERKFATEELFAGEIGKLSGLATAYDFHAVVRYLQFFTEERLPILWSAGTQFEFFKMLFLDSTLADLLNKAFSAAQRYDTDYRNRRNQLTLRTDALARRAKPTDIEVGALDAMIKVAEQEFESATKLFGEKRDAFSELQRDARSLDLQFDQGEADIGELELELQQLDATFIAEALPGLDDKLRFLMQGLGAGRGCFVCGSNGAKEVAAIGRSLKDGHCFVCHATLSGSGAIGKGAKVQLLSAHKVRAQEERLEILRSQMLAIDARRQANSESYAEATQQLKKAATYRSTKLQALDALRAQRPSVPDQLSEQQADIDREEAELETLDVLRKAKAAEYRKGIVKAKALMDDVKEELRIKLTDYAEAFLQEKVVVSFKTDERVSIATGVGDVAIPTFSINMTSSTHAVPQERLTSDSVSESQKEFLDLAFRMTLLDMVCGNGNTMMIIETPEASLDSWFMLRAAQLMRRFAPNKSARAGKADRIDTAGKQPDRKLIATSNLNGTAMIPALLGLLDDKGKVRKRTDQHDPHLIDLLALTATANVLKDPEANALLQEEYRRFVNA